MRRAAGVAALAAMLRPSAAILVAKNSPCEVKCGNTLDATTGPDMTCDDAAYATSSGGAVFQGCVRCEAASNYTSNGQSDLKWALYNLRFATSYCLFGDPNNPDFGTNPCITAPACGPLKDAIEWNNLTTAGGAYDYCQKWPGNQLAKCTACLTGGGDQVYIPNFLTYLDGACRQQPQPGTNVSVDGDIFSPTLINVTEPTPPPLYTFAPESQGPISLGARVGIALGGLAFLLIVAGFCIVCNGKRRRRAYLHSLEKRVADQGWPHPAAPQTATASSSRKVTQQDMFETPTSQRPLRGWEDSPVSAGTEVTDRTFGGGRHFSPYSSTYNSPVSAIEAPHMNWPALRPQTLEQVREADPTPPSASAHQSTTNVAQPPALASGELRAFSDWPTSAQEKLMQSQAHPQEHHREPQRASALPIGIALGGDEASLRSKNSNPAFLSTSNSKNSLRDAGYHQPDAVAYGEREAYEMHEVDNDGVRAGSAGGSNSSGSGNEYQYHPHSRRQQPGVLAADYQQYLAQQKQQSQQQQQPVLLHHPGFGRRNGSGKFTEGLTEEDARNGHAL